MLNKLHDVKPVHAIIQVQLKKKNFKSTKFKFIQF